MTMAAIPSTTAGLRCLPPAPTAAGGSGFETLSDTFTGFLRNKSGRLEGHQHDDHGERKDILVGAGDVGHQRRQRRAAQYL